MAAVLRSFGDMAERMLFYLLAAGAGTRRGASKVIGMLWHGWLGSLYNYGQFFNRGLLFHAHGQGRRTEFLE